MGAVEATSRSYNRLQNCVIRPTRQMYKESDLGPSMFTFGGVSVCRWDFSLQNSRGMALRCSHWRPTQAFAGCLSPFSADQCSPSSQGIQPHSCIIYLHGNAGSRMESLDVLPCALAMGCSFFAFDFSGSGLSGGEHVSLGWYEQHDLASVITHLRSTNSAGRLFLWGRSMGAATALFYAASRRQSCEVHGMVLDSPFSDFESVATERVDHAASKGHISSGASCIAPLMLVMLSSSIEAAAGFDPRKLEPITAASHCTVPAFFIVAEQDRFVSPSHGKRVFAAYSGAKGLLSCNGDHNSKRPRSVYEYAEKFLEPLLPSSKASKPEGVTVHNELKPPWVEPSEDDGWFSSLFSGSICEALPTSTSARSVERTEYVSMPAYRDAVPQHEQAKRPRGLVSLAGAMRRSKHASLPLGALEGFTGFSVVDALSSSPQRRSSVISGSTAHEWPAVDGLSQAQRHPRGGAFTDRSSLAAPHLMERRSRQVCV